eukprot:scaffold12886_cov80-Skeletonema_dohrnii-CCMP3373.AAC.2
MPLASDYDTAFMGKDTVPLQFIKMPPMSTFPRAILTLRKQAIFSVLEVTRLVTLTLALLQHVHVLGPLALF